MSHPAERKFQPYICPPEHQLGRPQDLNAEWYVLCALILLPDVYDEVFQILDRRDFLYDWNKWTWDAIVTLVNQDAQVNREAVIRQMQRDIEYNQPLEIEAHVDRIIWSCPTPSNAKYYARFVAEDAVRRRICEEAPLLTAIANNYDYTIEDVRERVEAIVAGAIDPLQNESQSGHSSDLAGEVVSEILADCEAGRRKTGAETGFPDLDYALSGLNAGEVILLAARTSVGKSAMALKMTEAFCKRGDKVLYFSLEMSKQSLMERLISMHTRIPLTLIRNRALSAYQQSQLKMAADAIADWDLLIDEKPGITPQYVRSRCRVFARRRPISLVVVDHMHIMEPSLKTGDEVKDLAAIVKDLHNFSKDLNVPVLLLAQLNRGPESRPDSTPTMRDIRGSGGIEENSDCILALHRPDYKKMREKGEALPEVEQAELHILKNRNGPTGGVIAIAYQSACVRYDGASDREYGSAPVTGIPVTDRLPKTTTAQPSMAIDTTAQTGPDWAPNIIGDPFAEEPPSSTQPPAEPVGAFFAGMETNHATG